MEPILRDKSWEQARRRAFLIGAVGAVLSLFGAFLTPGQFFRSYLLAYIFWVWVALGSMAVVMLHHLVGGAWGLVIQRFLESGTRTLPFMALLFLPVLLGLSHLYPWIPDGHAPAEDIMRHKSLYLNVPFFLMRSAVYFLLWLGIAYFLNKWSLEQDTALDPSRTRRRLQLLSGPGLVLYGLTVTFASVDWIMSLEPLWYSTIYGMLAMVSQVLSTLALAILALAFFSDREPLARVLRPDHFHDLGNLLLAFVLLWAYVSFSQYLIIWSGNLPEEIPWYLKRTTGGWQWVVLGLIVFHFAVPFLLLLSRETKRRARALVALAIGILAGRWVDLFWTIIPAFSDEGLGLHWMDFVAPVALGGIWVGIFLSRLSERPLLPIHGPGLERASGHG